MNRKVLFNNDWEFAKSSLEVATYENLTFHEVELPHDWLIFNTLELYENSIGWYRKHFKKPQDAQRIIVCFDGVYMNSSVYVNQQLVGEWKYGYSSFEHDITEALVEGENEIIVKVVHESPNSRWYSGAGIYRNVWLKTRKEHYIESDGTYITSEKKEGKWVVDINTEVTIQKNAQLTHSIMYQDQVIATSTETIQADDGQKLNNLQKITINDPLLWSTETPNLYKLITQLQVGEKIAESLSQNIGFRTVILDSETGFHLNGTKMKLNGVCEHHDLGALGAAFNPVALKRRLHILKEMGVNAIRTAHNMPAPELMEMADEMGFLIVSEAFDMWERPKTEFDYARFFNEWAANDVKSWVRRDRNHPSLLMWSIGNEIYDTHAGERGQEITRMLMEEVKKHDPKGNGWVTIGSNYMPWENAQKCADIVKIAGYNYAEKYYQQHHEEHPDWVIYGSETASVVQSRGIYHFPYEAAILADDDKQCSSLGNSSTSWGAKSAEACILAERDTPFSLGQFLWTGFDYIGEPTPYHTKNSYFGQIDTATFKKDSFYIYQAAWTNYKTHPMVHIFPYWDFNEGQIIDVRVCSNAPKIELQLNGEMVGTYDIDHAYGTELVGWWKIPYEKGELKAIAYDEEGNIIATDVRRSFKEAKKISLQADKNTLVANGADLIFIEITTEDEDGYLVENANNRVFVEVSGAGRLVGLDNGDSTDYDQYKGTNRRLFSGKLMAMIASTFDTGAIEVKVHSPGLEGKAIELKSVTSEETSKLGRSTTFMENKDLPIVIGEKEEIPIRKIELKSEMGQEFTPSYKEIHVRAILHPENASYHDMEWSVVHDGGIPTNLANVDSNGQHAIVTALGDGEFRLRCTSKNGTEKIKLISELEFKATGLGTAYKDPYEFVSGGLYDYSKGEVGSGNERGVATSRDGETHVGFRHLDFGRYGSDTITIPIFALNSDEYSLQIWEGMPNEKDSELLADVIYQKEMKWNVYQEETFRLSKRLKGITSICFVLKDKVHIKGFSFEKKNRAFETNMALDCDHLYGDTFKRTDNSVEGIGNNVSIEYDDFNFTEKGATKLVLCGRSPIDKNTIHIRFEDENGETRQLVDFYHTENYEEHTFELERIVGNQKITFVFLPGCNFDFKWFRFEK